MVRVFLMYLTLGSFSLIAQNNPDISFETYREAGLFSSSATYAPGIMLNRNQLNYHLNFFGEYHFNRKVSAKSDSYWFLNSPNQKINELQLFRSYFGMFYHVNNNSHSNWDLKLGLMPGVTYSKRMEADMGIAMNTSRSFAPSVNFAVGFDYYVWKYFHFFSQLSLVNSTARGLHQGSQRLDEVLFSAGLGFQIPTKRILSALY